MAVPLQSAARAPLRPRCHRIAVTMPLQSARAPPRPRCHCLAHRRAARRRADCHCSQHDHFRSLWLRGSTHNAVSSWPMAATECRALLHCTEVRAMRLWPLVERDWLPALSMSPLRRRARHTGAPLRDCDAMAGGGARVHQAQVAMPWHCCGCSWYVRSLAEGLKVAALARLHLSTNNTAPVTASRGHCRDRWSLLPFVAVIACPWRPVAATAEAAGCRCACQWVRLSAGRCSTARRYITLCDFGL